MDTTPAPPPSEPGGGRNRNNRRSRPDPNPATAPSDAQPSSSGSSTPAQGRRHAHPRSRRRPAAGENGNTPASPASDSVVEGGHSQRRPKPKPRNPQRIVDGDTNGLTQPHHSRRGTRFNAGLTRASDGPSSARTLRKERYALPDTGADGLTATLIRSLSIPPYTDCPICFSSIHPAQPTWSCSPTTPVIDEEPQYCWTTFHLKCIRSWSEKSYNEIKEAWRAKGEEREGEWRCPGCQAKRNTLVGGYKCFCGSTPSPNARLATPHSCGNPCSRTRKVCPHPCPLSCHPGPCPPCKVMLEVPCPCLRHRIVPVRCGEDTRVSCGEVCDRVLNCGQHKCRRTCHSGPCGHCEEFATQACWCGGESRQIVCGEGDRWTDGAGCDGHSGSVDYMGFSCGKVCKRLYDCGKHSCERLCHPPSSTPSICPSSPAQVTTCPCGKRHIGTDFPSRATCEDTIPTCQAPCLKRRSTCDHPCQAICHLGDCPPCQETVTHPCRCGNTRREVKCAELFVRDDEVGIQVEAPVFCDKPCQALRACGRHRCSRVCCPLASFALAKGKGKKRIIDPSDVGEGPGGLHECDLVCGKMLGCGNHRCEERDHRGPCGRCLRSSFEEMVCFCGRTVLEPPVPCGTKIECSYPCVLPPPDCGHPKTPHVCHGGDISCPPCPFLTTKLCACGTKMVGNVKCSLDRDKIGCGTVCGKQLSCGFHRCGRVCHSGECRPCATQCGKARKLCLPAVHPCTDPCHAPAVCSEREPCQTIITLTCPCGKIKQSVRCGRSTASPSGRSDIIKCTSECEIAKRNARLADALGIVPKGTNGGASGQAVYSDDLVAFARANEKFLMIVEKAFMDFVSSTKKTQVLPHMPMDRRQFVIELAGVYRLDTQMVDQEPHRSVQLIRRIDTRIPTPVLSAYIASSGARGRPNFGKLGNLSRSTVTPPAGVAPKPSTSGTVTPRGWGAGVALAGSRPATPPEAPTRPVSQTQMYRPPGARLTPAVPTIVPAPVDVAANGRGADVPDDWEDDVEEVA